MSFEDMHLFPAARRHLTAEDWRELEDQIAAEPDFGRRATRRCAILRREILNWEKQNSDGDAAPCPAYSGAGPVPIKASPMVTPSPWAITGLRSSSAI